MIETKHNDFITPCQSGFHNCTVLREFDFFKLSFPCSDATRPNLFFLVAFLTTGLIELLSAMTAGSKNCLIDDYHCQ